MTLDHGQEQGKDQEDRKNTKVVRKTAIIN